LELGASAQLAWTYVPRRVLRNLVALNHSLLLLAPTLDGSDADVEAAALFSARAWEALARTQEGVSRRTALLNGSILYQLAGYQANASCLARAAQAPSSWTTDISIDGLVSAFLQRLLVRVVQSSPLLATPPVDLPSDLPLLQMATNGLMAQALKLAAQFLLTGEASLLRQAGEDLELAEQAYAADGDAPHANISASIRRLLPLISRRSTWSILGPQLPQDARWRRYLRVLARGLGPTVLASRSVSEVWPSQLSAIAAGLFSDRSTQIIRMPTSAGKTRIAEAAIVHSLASRPGGRALYIAPFRALVGEVQEGFGRLFADLGYGSAPLAGAYDYDAMQGDMAQEDELLIATPEKLDLVLRVTPEILETVDVVVLDEGHIVADPERGPKYELLISRLRRRLPRARFILLSAVVPDQTLEDFAAWLGATPDRVVKQEWRPSVLRHAALYWRDGAGRLEYARALPDAEQPLFVPRIVQQKQYETLNATTGRLNHQRFPSDSRAQVAAELAFEFVNRGPVLVFCMQTDWAVAVGSAFRRRLELAGDGRWASTATDVASATGNPTSVVVAEEWLGADHEVTSLLREGIGVHHGRLPDALRSAIEDDVRNRRLKIVVATTTLAQGVNLPVRTVIFHSCWSRPGGVTARRLSARDYWNIAGRAGRAGEETEGLAVHLVIDDKDRRDFQYYSQHRLTVEPVWSALFRLLQGVARQRLSVEGLGAEIDADVLALLAEEVDFEGSLTELLDGSLFAVQGRRVSAEETRVLIRDAEEAIASVAARVPDKSKRGLYSVTGLSSQSCVALEEFIAGHLDELDRLLRHYSLAAPYRFLRLARQALVGTAEMAPRFDYPGDTDELLRLWILGNPVSELMRVVPEGVAVDELAQFIQDSFVYRLPWGLSGLLALLRRAFPNGGLDGAFAMLESLPAMVRHGVPTREATWAMSAGVTSRRLALLLAERFGRTDASPRAFRQWLADTPAELLEEFGLTGVDLRQTLRTAAAIAPNALVGEIEARHAFFPRPVAVRILTRARGVAGALASGVGLIVQRDYDNAYDRNAVALIYGDERIAYLPRHLAQALAPGMDAGESLVATVNRVDLGDGSLDLVLEPQRGS
jgi:replicative superfamily II helicase